MPKQLLSHGKRVPFLSTRSQELGRKPGGHHSNALLHCNPQQRCQEKKWREKKKNNKTTWRVSRGEGCYMVILVVVCIYFCVCVCGGGAGGVLVIK